MYTMKVNNKQYKIIMDILVKKDKFQIADILKKSTLSRSGISKILASLVDDGILRRTAKRGANVFYVLCVNRLALEAVFIYKNMLTIDELARAWNVKPHTAQKYIKKFVDDNTISKKGTPPYKITYMLQNKKQLPEFLKPFLWSYNINQMDMENDKNIIIKNVLDLGTRESVIWVKDKYSQEDIVQVIQNSIYSDWSSKSINYWMHIYNVVPKKNRIRK